MFGNFETDPWQQKNVISEQRYYYNKLKNMAICSTIRYPHEKKS
jgi:hypothetical protein